MVQLLPCSGIYGRYRKSCTWRHHRRFRYRNSQRAANSYSLWSFSSRKCIRNASGICFQTQKEKIRIGVRSRTSFSKDGSIASSLSKTWNARSKNCFQVLDYRNHAGCINDSNIEIEIDETLGNTWRWREWCWYSSTCTKKRI